MSRALLLAAVLVGGCKSKPAAESTQPAAESTQAAAEPTQPGSTVGAEELGTFTCKDVQNDACIGATDTFEATAPVVHMTYKTKDIPKNGDIYVIQWIAEDVGQAAPPNTVIATLNEEVGDAAPGLKNYVVNSRLTRPTAGWPVGTYRVEVKLADQLLTTARFSIQ